MYDKKTSTNICKPEGARRTGVSYSHELSEFVVGRANTQEKEQIHGTIERVCVFLLARSSPPYLIKGEVASS